MTPTPMHHEISTWPHFATAVRAQGCHLLRRLPEFPEAVLVTGCQRSGTTMLSRILTESDGMTRYWFGRDDELDAALILSGTVPHKPQGRYCFQTTYVNECYPEYFTQAGRAQIIWVLRNPYSVIYSMMYNWKAYALDELFQACGAPLLRGSEKVSYKLLGLAGVRRVRQACLAYNGKLSHLFALAQQFAPARLTIVDYDELVAAKQELLPALYQFIDLPYRADYAAKIHGQSVSKASGLSAEETAVIQSLCQPVYQKAQALADYRLSAEERAS